MRKTVTVFGERIWMKCLGKVSMSRPVQFEKIPHVWEWTFGGSNRCWPDPTCHEFFLENPVGRGLLAKKMRLNIDGIRLPNFEDSANFLKYPGDREEDLEMRLDTVIVEPDGERLVLVWRGRHNLQRRFHNVRRISVACDSI